jgi:hypothetical protein
MNERERHAYLLGQDARQIQEDANSMGRSAGKAGDQELLIAAMRVGTAAAELRAVCLALDPKSLEKIADEEARPMNDA